MDEKHRRPGDRELVPCGYARARKMRHARPRSSVVSPVMESSVSWGRRNVNSGRASVDKAAGGPHNTGMTIPGLNMNPLEAILTWCREADPHPWYPSTITQVYGIPREQLDPYLDELRLGGLI